MEEKWALRISHSESVPINLGIDMTVGNENVWPSVVVRIKELQTESEERDTDWAEVGGTCQVGEFAMVIVVKQVISIVREIGLRDVGPSVVVVIRGVDPHTSLLPAVAAVGHPGLGPYFGNPPFTVAVIDHARRRGVGDRRLEPAVGARAYPHH